MHKQTIGFALPLIFLSNMVLAQVEELNNTEMTQAYIEDGAIVIKQRIRTNQKLKKKQEADFKLGAGEPAIGEEVQIKERSAQNNALNQQLQYEIIDSAPQRQLTQFEQQSATADVTLIPYQSNTVLTEQARVDNIVRDGLGLADSIPITQDLMVQYITSFSGESSNNLSGPQQIVTDYGLQISAPNPDGRLEPGIFFTGDNSMSAEINQQQIIWKLLLPIQE